MTRRIPETGARRALAVVLVLMPLVALAPVVWAQSNRVVLRVNDEIATLYDYELLKQEQLAALARAELSEERKQQFAARIGEETMRQLFEEMLLLSRADQLGVVVSPSQLDQTMRSAMEGYGVESVEEFVRGLEQTGMSLERWREQMRRSIIVREVMGREIQERVTLEEEDLRRYYRAHAEDFRRPRRVELREIVVLDDAGMDEAEQRRVATELAAMIESEDPALEDRIQALRASGRTTGWIELGWVLADDLDSRLAAVVAALDAGDVGAPTAARGGLHVLQALDVEQSRIEEFQAVRDQIEQTERARLFEQEAQSYLEELVASSFVDSRPPPEAASFRPLESLSAEEEGAEEGG